MGCSGVPRAFCPRALYGWCCSAPLHLNFAHLVFFSLYFMQARQMLLGENTAFLWGEGAVMDPNHCFFAPSTHSSRDGTIPPPASNPNCHTTQPVCAVLRALFS